MKRHTLIVGAMGLLLAAGVHLQADPPRPKPEKKDPETIKRLAVTEITKLEGTVESDARGPEQPVIKVNLRRSKVADGDLPLFKDLRGVQHLDLCMTGVTNLSELTKWTSLRTLNISSTRITDEGLEAIKRFGQLESLDLSCTTITEKGLQHLQGLRGLQSLNLGTTRLTNKGLEALKKLTGLRRLDLCGATGFTDAGLRNLRSLTNLEYLAMRHTLVTEKGIQELKGMPKLRLLDLVATRVDTNSVRKLVPLLPNTRILVTGPNSVGE